MLIDGDWRDATGKATFDSINPANGEVWAKFPEASAEDVDQAVRAAERAFSGGPWPAMSPTERGHCLRKLADILIDNAEHLAQIETT